MFKIKMIYDNHNQRFKTKNQKNMTTEEAFQRLKRIMTNTGKWKLKKLIDILKLFTTSELWY